MLDEKLQRQDKTGLEKMPVKGFTFGYGARKGDFLKAETRDSFEKLCEIPINWVTIAFNIRIQTKNTMEIRYDFNRDVTDHELEHIIEHAHKKGLKVCLKPMIDCLDQEWRADIDFRDDDGAWDKYFYEYKGFLIHYAELAEYTGCEMLCLGCEMLGMEKKEAHWRDLIKKVRDRYEGLLTYNTNHGKEMAANWYDAIDIIGTSGYFPVADGPEDSLDDMKKRWEEVSDYLEQVHKKWKKPILFMEIGCRSARGMATMPWDFKHTREPYDEREQADFYESAIIVLKEKPWFLGFFWWDWSVRLYQKEQAKTDCGFGVYGKEAGRRLKQYYSEKEFF